MQEFKRYEVGKAVESFIKHQEGTVFDISDEGATFIAFFKDPTNNEIEQFQSGNKFEIRYSIINGIIVMTFKIGNLNWMDAPYSPQLSKNLTKFTLPNEGQGLALTVMLVDPSTGIIKSLRLIGLGEKFSKKLLGTVMEKSLEDLSINDYNSKLNSVFRFTTKQIVEMSKDYYKLQ